MSRTIDGILKDWGERLYYEPISGRRAKCTVTCSSSSTAKRPLKATGSARVREKLILTTGKAPEVLVKISGGGKGMRQVKAHLDYISRNGVVELENDDGEIILGREAVQDVRDEWKSGQYGIPENGSRKEAFNIVLSMPPRTDRRAVKDAARYFARSEFAENHAYVFAAHDDEKHPHVHLCVKSLGFDGCRLNPRKADLQHWRERFAEALREQGIEANATPRKARTARATVKQAVRHLEKSDRPVDVKQTKQRNNSETFKTMTHGYGQIAKALARGDETDRRLAVKITRFVGDMLSNNALTKPYRANESDKVHKTLQTHEPDGSDRGGLNR